MMTPENPSGKGYDIPTSQTLKSGMTVSKTLGLEDIYKHQEKFYGVDVDFKVYETLLRTFFNLMREEVMEREYTYTLPFNLGFINIQPIDSRVSFDSKGNITPYGTTAAIDGKYMAEAKRKHRFARMRFNLNIKRLFKMRWFKGTFKNKSFYYFEPNKLIKKRLFDRHETHELC